MKAFSFLQDIYEKEISPRRKNPKKEEIFDLDCGERGTGKRSILYWYEIQYFII
jgi:hypothetical protein